MLTPLNNSHLIKKFKINASLDSRNLEQLSKAFKNLEFLEFETMLQPQVDFSQFLFSMNRLKTLKIRNSAPYEKL